MLVKRIVSYLAIILLGLQILLSNTPSVKGLPVISQVTLLCM
jgi:hypothetical protein